MHDVHHSHHAPPNLRQRLELSLKLRINDCYQCGKCAAGCPLVEEMDFTPNQILRMLQLELPQLEERILGSMGIWLCLACEQCYSRCPKDVNIPEIMDYLRAESIRLGKVNPAAKDIVAFHKSFLAALRKSGRMHEVSLFVQYKTRTMHLFQDVGSAPKLFWDGKLKLMPDKIKGRDAVRRIFDKVESLKGDN